MLLWSLAPWCWETSLKATASCASLARIGLNPSCLTLCGFMCRVEVLRDMDRFGSQKHSFPSGHVPCCQVRTSRLRALGQPG